MTKMRPLGLSGRRFALCLALGLAVGLCGVLASLPVHATMGGLNQGAQATKSADGLSTSARAVPSDLQRLWRDKPNEGFNHPLVNKKAPHQIVVFGDSLGDGMWAGLYRLLRDDRSITVIKQSRVATGFARADLFDWNAKLNQILRAHRVDVAVLVFGTNDRQTIVVNGRQLRLRSPEWEAAYTARLRDFVAQLQAHGASVYWIGLPVMRSSAFGADMNYFNSLFKRVAGEMGVRYVPSWSAFADASGSYNDYGADETGRMRRLRADDGIHMTMNGYTKLASLVSNTIRNELSSSRDTKTAAKAPSPLDIDVFDAGLPQALPEAALSSVSEGLAARGGPVVPELVSASASSAELPEGLGLRRQIYEFVPAYPGRADDFSWPPR